MSLKSPSLFKTFRLSLLLLSAEFFSVCFLITRSHTPPLQPPTLSFFTSTSLYFTSDPTKTPCTAAHNEVRFFHMLMLLLTAQHTAQSAGQSCYRKQGCAHVRAHMHTHTTHVQRNWRQFQLIQMNCRRDAFRFVDEPPVSTE